MKTPEQRENDMLEAAKNYAQQYEGLMYTIGSIAGVSGIRMAFERGVHFGLHQALDITVEREKAERNAEQHWISVEERLPEIPDTRSISEDVLWLTRYGEMEVSCLERLRSEFRVDWGEAGLLKLDQFTHWMPLPEPPEVE